MMVTSRCSRIFSLLVLLQPGSAFVEFSLRQQQQPVVRNWILFTEPTPSSSSSSSSSSSAARDLQAEAERLLARAREIRSQIPVDKSTTETTRASGKTQVPLASNSPWLCTPLQQSTKEQVGFDYRLYVDIGREPGTWMDPRWGASGRRIEFSLDVRFVDTLLVESKDYDSIIWKKTAGTSNFFATRNSALKVLQSANFARLRNGFDRMKCYGGVYVLDTTSSSSPLAPSTMRFMVQVEGTEDYGDVTIPSGCLYFNLPCFANNIALLSSKEGTVTIKQVGWNTGWRREESRILGTVRAVSLEKARQRDGF